MAIPLGPLKDLFSETKKKGDKNSRVSALLYFVVMAVAFLLLRKLTLWTFYNFIPTIQITFITVILYFVVILFFALTVVSFVIALSFLFSIFSWRKK